MWRKEQDDALPVDIDILYPNLNSRWGYLASVIASGVRQLLGSCFRSGRMAHD